MVEVDSENAILHGAAERDADDDAGAGKDAARGEDTVDILAEVD